MAEKDVQEQYGIAYSMFIATLTKRISFAMMDVTVKPAMQKLINNAGKLDGNTDIFSSDKNSLKIWELNNLQSKYCSR